jgi:hypothetical protein
MKISSRVLLTVSLLMFAVACSKQGQGDRCNISNASNDCEDNLYCLPPQGGGQFGSCDPAADDQLICMPYRCCPQFPSVPTDPRCDGYSNVLPTGTETGTGGSDAGSDAGQ